MLEDLFSVLYLVLRRLNDVAMHRPLPSHFYSLFPIIVLMGLLICRVPAADVVPSVAATPLPVFIGPERAPAQLPPPIPWADLHFDLGHGAVLVPAQAKPVIELDGNWRCSGLVTSTTRFPDEAQLDRGWQEAAFDDKSWDSIQVPLDWYRAYPKARTTAAPYVLGWYRRSFDLDAAAVQRCTILHFGVAGYEADLWVNGHRAGNHHGDFTPWDIDISAWATPGSNVLAVRVRSDMGPKFGAGDRAWHTYGSQWSISNIRGGLWQSCRLTLEPKLRVIEALVSPQRERGSLRVDWRIDNRTGSAQRVALRSVVQNARSGAVIDRPADVVIGQIDLAPGDNSGTAEVLVPGIRSWSPEQPELYWLCLVAEQEGAVAGFGCERFGFREFTVRDGRFFLNGVRTYLFGENLKSLSYAGAGESASAYAARIDHDLSGLRRNGYNIFRTAHMPTEPLLLQRADELGMMVYNEWAWSFTDRLDPVEFPQRNTQEVSEWVRRDHNHPSVVMWSCGNEVHYDDEAVRVQLDRQVALIRTLDHSHRPVSTFSGAAYGYGAKALDTDVLDRHSYHGLSGGPWSSWERNSAEARAFADRAYGANWNTHIPFIIWESVGFSWGQLSDPAFRPGNVDDYLSYAGRTSTWGTPAGIGFAGTIGLAAFLDPQHGLADARRTYGRRIAEFIRRDPQVSGFAPWFSDPDLADARQWTQPVFASLYGANRIALRHPLGGHTYEQNMEVINDGDVALGKATAHLSLAGGAAEELPIAVIDLPDLPAGNRMVVPVTIFFPEPTATGWWQLRLRIEVSGRQVSCLGYNLFVAPSTLTHAALGPARSVAMLPGTGETAVRRWLTDLGIAVHSIADLENTSGCEVIIVPPGCLLSKADSIALRTWIGAGGDALVLEQSAGAVAALGQSAVPAGNTFVDLVCPAHPLFTDLSQAALDTSDHLKGGWWVEAALKPLTVNVLAARGTFLGLNDGVGAVISEGSLGKGRLLASQLLALGQWDIDSAATIYLRNLARYLLTTGAKPAVGIRPWQETVKGLGVESERCRPLDVRAVANRAFADETAGDGAGGWTDQGGNDFRTMPTGPQTLHGVPFTLIDPETNGGRACVLLGGGGLPQFPREVNGVQIGGQVSRLFFLHTAAWVSGASRVILTYRIHYADGVLVEVPVRTGIEIADWWNPSELPGALLGICQTNAQLHDIGAFLMTWDNPRPDVAVATIDALSSGIAVPFVLAITAEMAHPMPARFSTAGDAGAWKTLIEWAGAASQKDGVGLPVISDGGTVPGGASGVRIAFPASPPSADAKIRYWGTPTAFLVLPTSEKAKLTSSQRAMTFWLKAENSGSIDMVLPFVSWRDTLQAAVHLDATAGWRKVRLDLAADFKQARGKSWKPSDLLGELFLFHGRRTAADAPGPAALTIEIADLRFE